jgi:hypothetical protein
MGDGNLRMLDNTRNIQMLNNCNLLKNSKMDVLNWKCHDFHYICSKLYDRGIGCKCIILLTLEDELYDIYKNG